MANKLIGTTWQEISRVLDIRVDRKQQVETNVGHSDESPLARESLCRKGVELPSLLTARPQESNATRGGHYQVTVSI